MARYFRKFPIVIAHRGASNRERENSARAIEASILCGADMIEVDLRTTRDGFIVLHHDRDTYRLSGERMVIRDSTREELKGLTLEGGGSILLLEEALEIVSGRVPVNLELKSGGLGNTVAELLEHLSYPGQIFVSSFYPEELDALKEHSPRIPTSRLLKNPTRESIQEAAESGHVSINVSRRHLKEWMVKSSAMQGIALLVYTVDDRASFTRMAEAGVLGIFTNVPEEMVKWRDDL